MTTLKRAQIVVLAIACITLCHKPVKAQISTAKPWTFWWWMGSAVTDKDIKYNLENFKRSGIGGVHIIPIYGVKGYENMFEPFLGEKYMKSVAYTVAEAKRLGLGVDMTTGTGWPFGGPNISEAQSAKKWVYRNGEFVAVSTQQKVKRAAPGGAGYVADPYDKGVTKHYLVRFDSAFAGKNIPLRSAYNDSYEVYGANWTNNFLSEFQKRRGYDFRTVAKIFLDTTANTEPARLVKMDYQQTLSELLVDGYKAWTDWAAKHHLQSRYQAHGSPGNILDLYDLATIPETEAFGSSVFPIPMLRVDPDYDPAKGRPNPLMMKFASSEAGVSGKKLISSETCTWLADHFKEALSQCKPQVDELFAAGINHIFYHGTPYSPKDEMYPGWLFYASVNFGPTSHFYNEFPLLNKYVEHCQTILQASKPDNDVLIYFPIQEIWLDHNPDGTGIRQLDVHHSEGWFMGHPMGKISKELTDKGFSFDYISDKQLADLKVVNGKVQRSGIAYKVIVIPACTHIPVATMERLQQLGKQGATIMFDHLMPEHPMGYADYQQHSAMFETMEKAMQADTKHFPVSNDLGADLVKRGVSKENITEAGLRFIRKNKNGKVVYFITNLGNQFHGGWVGIGKGNSANLWGYDALNNKKFSFPKRKVGGQTQLYLSLLPSQSCFVIEEATAAPVVSVPKAYETYNVNNGWQVQFMTGRPAYHQSFKIDTLKSWTSLSDTAAFYTGTAKYTGTVNIPANVAAKKDLMIDLGAVNESAVVKINGKVVGTAWSLPFRLNIPQGILVAGKNTFEVTVQNLSANYMKVYDKQHPEWKKFYEINMVNINYLPFTTDHWKVMPSGLSTNNMKILYR